MFLTDSKKIRTGLFRMITAACIAVVPLGAMAAGQPATEPAEQLEGGEIVVLEAEPVVSEHVPLALQEPEGFTSDYGESKIAKKMTQAEKARNAAENDGWGGAITIIAMCIVIGALIVLSVLFMIFGKVSETIISSKKKKAKVAAEHDDHENNQDLAPGEVIAAIAIALTEHFGEGHDVEDTILTIRRLQKAYSPWNSKIYNLRNPQQHHRNPSTEINFNESKRIQI